MLHIAVPPLRGWLFPSLVILGNFWLVELCLFHILISSLINLGIESFSETCLAISQVTWLDANHATMQVLVSISEDVILYFLGNG